MEHNKLSFFNKPKKAKMIGLLIVFLWIILLNVIYQILHAKGLTHIGGLEIVNWSFFLSVTVFFMQEELSYKERFLTTLLGGAVGLPPYLSLAAVVTGSALFGVAGMFLSVPITSVIYTLAKAWVHKKEKAPPAAPAEEEPSKEARDADTLSGPQ